jgi:hypothetical protein
MTWSAVGGLSAPRIRLVGGAPIGSVIAVSDGDVPDGVLQSALELAVAFAVVSAKAKPPQPFPSPLRKFLRFHKLPPGALPVVRAAVEADEDYRGRLAMLASSALVDEIGLLWITRPDGWESTMERLLGDLDDEQDAADARAEKRRREAAEAASLRARQEAVEAVAALQRERDAVAALTAERDRLATELASTRRQLEETTRAARKREAGARPVDERASAASDEVVALRARLVDAEAARDNALAARAAEPVTTDQDRVRALLGEALALLPAPAAARARRRARSPIAVPGGLYGDSEAAGEHLLRSAGVLVLVDGYNVAMLGWPDLLLEQQRDRCVLAAENIARRWGTDVHLVFDGADVVGAHGRGRRLVRVSFSAAGVSADDALRAEVAATDPGRHVVVVTNDQAILTDVRAAGANTLPSATFLALARR